MKRAIGLPEAVELETPGAALLRKLLPVARRIFTESFAHDYDRVAFERFCDEVYLPGGLMERDFTDPGVRWQIATVDGEPVGYAKLTPLRAAAPRPHPHALELQQIYVLAEWHGTGVADRLMQWGLSKARELGAPEIYLTVFDHNERAKRFYRRFGFSEVGRCTFQLGGQIDDDRIWRASLNPDSTQSPVSTTV